MISMRQLLVVVGLGIASQVCAQDAAPVPGALYAEVHGIESYYVGLESYCIRLYAHAVDTQHVHGLVKSSWCRNQTPRVDFYDAQGNIVCTEYIYNNDVKSDFAKQYKMYKQIQSRLTMLPTVVDAGIARIKDLQASIELYDKDGHCIATAVADVGEFLKEGDALPAEVIKELENTVNNPEVLKNVRIQKTRLAVGFVDVVKNTVKTVKSVFKK